MATKSSRTVIPSGVSVTAEAGSLRFRTGYGPRVEGVVVRFPEEKFAAKQSFRDECDINVIMGRYLQTGMIPASSMQQLQARYGDCTGIDFREMAETVAAGRSAFELLPAAVRARFRNDPANLLEFVSNEANREEAREMGLLREEEFPAPLEQGGQGGSSTPPRGAQTGATVAGSEATLKPAASSQSAAPSAKQG